MFLHCCNLSHMHCFRHVRKSKHSWRTSRRSCYGHALAASRPLVFICAILWGYSTASSLMLAASSSARRSWRTSNRRARRISA